jgi:DNA-binding NtrC family response regulator
MRVRRSKAHISTGYARQRLMETTAFTAETFSGNILLVDDDPRLLALVETYLEEAGFEVSTAATGAEGLAAAKRDEPDVIVLDLGLPDIPGKQLLTTFRAECPRTQVIMFTAREDFDDVVDCIQLGAVDYLPKSADQTRLVTSIRNAIKQAELLQRVDSLTSELRKDDGVEAILGRSDAMADAVGLLRRAAQSDVTVLIQGESGTGKELAARAIHAESHRKSGPFVAINCGAIPEGLIESELFGHEKGSFTGATATHQGCFERADGGTIFLDEIGELRADLQVRLLRVLQDSCVQRVGGTTVRRVNMRVVAASNRDLKSEALAGRFREDLYFRLAVFPVQLPALRDRIGDIELLTKAFLEKFSARYGKRLDGLTGEAVAALNAFPWPGNVRELENIIERAVILEDGERISLQSIPGDIKALIDQAQAPAAGSCGQIENGAFTAGTVSSQNGASDAQSLTGSATSETAATLDQIAPFAEEERRIILRALQAARWNVQEAAERLELGRATIYRKIERYGLRNRS